MSSGRSHARMNVKMNDHEVDEVAFLTGESSGMNKRALYDQDRVAVCSQKRAAVVAVLVFTGLFCVAVLIAFATPLTGSMCSSDATDARYLFKDELLDMDTLVSTSGEIYPWNNTRLPEFVKPLHYIISICPNLTTLDVTGWVVIRFVVTEESNFIVFHSHKIQIVERWVKEEVKESHLVEPLNISRLLEYPPHQQMYLELGEGSVLYPGRNYSLGISFKSNISREMEGFYISSYTTLEGEKRYLATTHFEPTYARSAFPCFDEPQLKATFKMVIIRDQKYRSMFNMPVQKIDMVYYGYNMELWRDEFEESVEMSTYLVAFVISDYESVRNVTEKGVEVAVHTSAELLPQASFALKSAVELMDYYEDFFGVPYPLKKQDLIAIPDFASGAMENWGLITYKETSILYDENSTDAVAHQYVAQIVAHELSHQWFGNLVTMKWWNDLWLNEGFASFIEHVGVDHIKPEWKMMEQIAIEKTQPALSLDALASSHPISVEVKDPSEIEGIFDFISYYKGAAVLYMLETVIGEKVLRQGLRTYLNEHKYGNADTKDLWAALTSSTNGSIKVKTIMDTWTFQTGFPLIRVALEYNRTVRATQERFLLNPQDNFTLTNQIDSSFSYKWYVPLTYVTDVQPTNMQLVWMNMTDYEFNLPQRTKWIKFNVNQTGFYRVHYEGSLWDNLIKVLQLKPFVLTAADRANLIDDAFSLCRAGVVKPDVPLQLSQYLLKEVEYVPWTTAIRHFASWSDVLYQTKAYSSIKKLMLKLLAPIYKRIGWEDSGSHLTKRDILSASVTCELDDAVKEAKARFQTWMRLGKPIPPNLREVIYSAGVRYGGLEAWEHCWAQYNKTFVPSEKRILLHALGSASDPWLLAQFLRLSLDADAIKPQDVKILLKVVAKNPAGRYLAWRHLRAHWSHFENVFGKGLASMGYIITAVISHFGTEFDYDEVTTFFETKDVGSGRRALNQSLETIRLNIRWLQENQNDIESWLQRKIY